MKNNTQEQTTHTRVFKAMPETHVFCDEEDYVHITQGDQRVMFSARFASDMVEAILEAERGDR